MSTTFAPLVRRPARSGPATAVAVGLVAVGGLAAWLVGTLVATDAWPDAAAGAVQAVGRTPLHAPGAVATTVVLALLGLALVLAAAIPGRPSRGLYLGAGELGDTAIPHRDVARHLRRRAGLVDGVQDVRVRVTSRRADVDVDTVVDDAAGVRERVRGAVEASLAELRPTSPPSVRVRVRAAAS